MENDREVVQIAEDVNAEGVDDPVRYEDCGIYANRLARSGSVVRVERCSSGDQASKAEGYTGCDCYLTEQIEPE